MAAKHFILNLIKGKRLINIDESVLRITDHRKRGWMSRSQQNMVTDGCRLNLINIIAGISSYGERFYTVNQGKTNGCTFNYFLKKLIEYLELIDKDWR